MGAARIPDESFNCNDNNIISDQDLASLHAIDPLKKNLYLTSARIKKTPSSFGQNFTQVNVLKLQINVINVRWIFLSHRLMLRTPQANAENEAKGKRGRGRPRKGKVEDEVVDSNKPEKKPERPPKNRFRI
ncbi:hypothetical protein BpHYR1_004723 [Brachionus plicatilis]|uniref:Uncharacterized protein n=1 Tax=Brachionus plicatilis TaxID=10195 RepID=A0A3M7R3R5_BRAPC|nr:hypothetical protein BpHYR1_004723 [Brachionus plicatilis]